MGSTISDAFSGFTTWLSDIWETISGIPNAIAHLFAPTPAESTQNNNKLKDTVQQQFGFVNQLKTTINNFNVAGQSFSIPISWGDWEGEINLDWYEPHRMRIRSGISTLFFLLTFLAIFRMFSSIFNIHSGSGTTAINHSIRGASK